MDRKKRIWTDWKMLCLFSGVLLSALTVVILTKDSAPYKFLEGHKPSGINIEHRTSAVIWESAYYVWDGKYGEVVDKAYDELHAKGFLFTTDGKSYGQFDGPAGETVVITKGPLTPGDRTNPDEFMVIVGRHTPNDWLAKLRRFFQPKSSR